MMFRATLIYPTDAPAYISFKMVVPNPLLKQAGITWIEVAEFSILFGEMTAKPKTAEKTPEQVLEWLKNYDPTLDACKHSAYVFDFAAKRVDVNMKRKTSPRRLSLKMYNTINRVIKQVKAKLQSDSPEVNFQVLFPKHNPDNRDDYWGVILSNIDAFGQPRLSPDDLFTHTSRIHPMLAF